MSKENPNISNQLVPMVVEQTPRVRGLTTSILGYLKRG